MRIQHTLKDIAKLPDVLHEIREHLRYHTESGFTTEEANGYAQQLDEVEAILLPEWKKRLGRAACEIRVDALPFLGGFMKIVIQRPEGDPVVVFAESYAHFHADMCDGSCYQYVYQKVLCYQDGLASGRVPL